MKIILTLLSLFLNNSFAQGDCNITQVQPSPFCQGSSFDINNEQDILDYQINFGDDGSGPRNVRIRSNLNVYDLNLKSPCEVSLDQKIKINATNNICIIGSKIKIKKQMDFTAQDVGIHSSENDFQIGEKAKVSATNLSISSNGSLTIKKQAKFDVNQNMEIIGSGIGAGNGILIGEKFKGSGVSLLINASSSLNIKKQFDANFSNLIDLKGIVQGSNSNFLLGEKAKINANKILINFKNAISFKKMAKFTSLNELIISTADGGEDSSVFIGEKGKFSGQNISVASNDEIILKKKNSFEGSSTIFVDSSNCNFLADVSFMTPTPQGRCIGPVNPNLVPVANAGSDKLLILGEPIQLDGSRSYDEDGDRLVFEWTIVSAPIGSNPVLVGAQSPFPKFTSDINGTYELSLRVNDGRVFSTPSTVLISNINVKPEILFLTDQLVSVGNTVLLDGSNTIDLDDDSLSFEWTLISKPVGSTSNIIDSSQDIAQIFIDVEGDYEFSLRAFDGELYSKIKTLVISTQSIRPKADINGPSIISKNQVGVFDGSNSLNPNGGTLSYKWSLVYQEPGSIVNFLAGTSNLTTFEANISGFYVVQLIVDDGIKISKPKTFFIKIQNQKPIISYSFAQERTVMTGTTNSFDLSESFDPDNDSLSYNWTINSKPNGSTTSFSDSSSSNPNITVDLSGQYEVSVEISDGEDSVVENFTLFANLPPLADFLISTGNFVGKSFNLDGSSSSDPDGDEIAFNWELLSTPTDSLANISISSLSSISILADKPGNYQVQLTVTDGLNESLPVVKTISVAANVDEAPVFVPQIDKDVEVGRGLKFNVEAVDPEGKPVKLTFDPSSDKVSGMSFDGASGAFSWNPTIDQTGTFNLRFSAYDGKNVVNQEFSINVTGPLFPGNTSITGSVLVSNNKVDFNEDKPVIGATVSVLNTNIVTTTNEFGQFTLENIPNIEEIVFKIDSSTSTNPPENGRYANFIEILHPIEGVDNVIDRPFYLPVINMESVTQVIPGQETVVFNPEINIEVRIPADSAVYPDGTPYQGDFSVSLVPANLAPVSLPPGLDLAQLITVQPSGIRFSIPASITYPNLDDLAPGEIINIIQMNDRSGRFEKVADGIVSADGKLIQSANGGLINTSWGAPLPSVGVGDFTNRELNTAPPSCNPYSCPKDTNSSQIDKISGEMVQDVEILTHKSLGEERGFKLIYSSLVATNTKVENIFESDSTTNSPAIFSIRPVLDGVPLNDIFSFPRETIDQDNQARNYVLPLIYSTAGYSTGIYSFDTQRIGEWAVTTSSVNASRDMGVRNRVVFKPETEMMGRAWTISNLIRVFEAENGDASIVKNGYEVYEYYYDEVSNKYESPVTQFNSLIKENGFFRLEEKNGTIHRFNDRGLLVSSTDRNNRQTVFEYNSQDKIEFIQDPAGLRTLFTYDSLGLSTITSPNGRVFNVSKDGSGNIIEIEFPDNSKRKFNYLENGLQIQKVYENGAVNSYEYNDDNQVIKVTKSGGEIINYEMIDSLDRVETPLLTRGSNLQRALNAKSLSLTVAKYANERVTKCSSYISRRRSRPRQINASTFALGYESEPKIVEKCFTVTKRRWVEEEIDPLGFKEIKNYDNNGNLSIQIDPTNRGKRNFYDQRGNLVRTSKYIDLRADQKFDYDTTFNQILQVKDYLGRITSFDQDENGNIIRVVDPLGQVTSLAYNSKGQVVSIVDYLGQETKLRYDLQSGNLVEVIDPKGSVTKSQYDLDGNLIQITDPMGQVTQFQYNQMNRVIKTIAADFSETSFTYDVKGNLLTVNDPRNGVTTFVYDERDRVIERVDPKNQKEEFLYDEEGLLFSKKDRNNLVTFYEYNDKNLLTNRILESGKEYLYEYDEAGRVLSIDDSQNSITYTYDEVGRVKTTSFEGANQPTLTLENEYDFNGNRTTLKTSEGDFVYSYDELNRLKTVENPNNLVFETVYDSIGRRAEMIIPNGTKVGYDYDKANRIKEISHLNGSTNLATFNYGYDDNGNITSVNTSRSALSNLSPTLSYTYDSINQLISATNPIQGQVDETFNYDNLGNRLRNQNQTQDAVYDESNRLLENQTHTYTYDLEGNMTSKEDKGNGFLTQYTWDEENQLIQIIERNSISTPATKTVNYVYDVLGRRIEKSVDGVITRYVYDNEDILFELDGNNQITKVFTHGGGIDEPLSFEDKLAQQTYFYHADHLGSIIGLSDSSGNLIQNYVYDSFGNVSIFDGSGTSFNLGSEPIKQPYGYTSRELDSESDLYYYRARYYNPSTGRFISEDPIDFQSGDTNFYRYVSNQPTSLTDPSGLLSFSGNFERRRCILKNSFAKYIKSALSIILGSAFLRSIAKTGFNTGLVELVRNRLAVPGLSKGLGSIANFAIGAALKAAAFGASFGAGLLAGGGIGAFFDTAVDNNQSALGISASTLGGLGFGSGIEGNGGFSGCKKACK